MAIGAIVVTAGSAISKARSLFKALGIKGKTQHLSWEEANGVIRPFANELSVKIIVEFSASQLKTLEENFFDKIVSFVTNGQGSNFWGADFRKKLLDGVNEVHFARWDAGPKIREHLWHLGMWVAMNIDRQRPEDLDKFLTFALDNTLFSADVAGEVDVAKTPSEQDVEKTEAQKKTRNVALAAAGVLGLLFFTK